MNRWSQDGVILLDGAMGTELERRGVALTTPLWSARANVDAVDLVEQIHSDYLDAGADAIITNTFRTHARNVHDAGVHVDAGELTQRAVDAALRARDRVNPAAAVLGSVAPLSDCYTPADAPTRADCHAEHAAIIAELLAAGVDGILLETMVSPHEALAAAAEAERLAPGRWMISMVLRSDDPPGTMLSGDPVVDLLPTFESALAIGINCASANSTRGHVELLRRMLPESMSIMAYANTDSYDTSTSSWTHGAHDDPDLYAEMAMTWIDAGARIIGGCCGTTPATIAALARRLGR
jgi:homocysteine S-methyltransferase